jgi:hypothetical protein
MKSFTSYITEAAVTGDCYQAAFHWILELDEGAIKHAKVCHGMVHGQGPLEGKKFGHAWGELGDIVFDQSNGKQLKMRKATYYALGKIDESEVFYYPGHKSLGKAARAKHYGPWDMTGATVDVSSSPVAEGKRIKAIVDRVKEIGKRKIKIPKNILSIIMKKNK